MPFNKDHKLGFTSKNDKPLDKLPLSIKLPQGLREKVRSIPNWQSELRDVIAYWVKQKLDHRS